MKLNIVPARTGAQWMLAGVRTFFKRPLALIGLFFMFMATLSVLALIPYVGSVLAMVLVPATTVGLMAATREVDAGRFPLPPILFIALRQGPQRTRAMLMLGLLYAAAVMLVMGITALIDGGRMAELTMGTGASAQDLMADRQLLVAMWVSTLLYLPVSLAFWHAPALVHWHAVPPLKSLFFSIVAVLRNTRAFLVYGALWMALSLGLGLALLLLLLMNSFRSDAALAAAALFPLSLVIAAMFFTSVWFTFRDSFSTDDEAAPEPPAA